MLRDSKGVSLVDTASGHKWPALDEQTPPTLTLHYTQSTASCGRPLNEDSVASEIEKFFNRTSEIRAACDARVTKLGGGGTVVPVDVQGACSYSVSAGPKLEYVVHFRLETLTL